MSLIDFEVATFEIEFNSVISATSSVAWGSTYIQGQGMIVRYGRDGRLVQPTTMPLTHMRYDFDNRPPGDVLRWGVYWRYVAGHAPQTGPLTTKKPGAVGLPLAFQRPRVTPCSAPAPSRDQYHRQHTMGSQRD